MYFTVKQKLKHLTKEEYRSLRKLSHIAKNLTNEAIYNVRQYYFKEEKYLKYADNYKLLKTSVNYRLLNSNMSQQILKEVDGSFKAFFGLLKLAKKGKYSFKDIKLPHYLPKDGYTTLVIGFVRINDNKLIIPYSNRFRKDNKTISINIPPVLKDRKIKEIRIIPKSSARYFEVQYTYEAECIQSNLNKDNALAIDLGIDNLCACVTSTGKSFIIDGRRLKSINQWYNKQNSYLQSIKDKQHINVKKTHKQYRLTSTRNRCVSAYLSKTARLIINYWLNNDIGNIVCGYNETFQKDLALGKVTNQSFVQIPYGRLRDKLEYLCNLYGINYIKQEESYTSKASFFDRDDIPVYNADNPKDNSFSGTRVKRGLYKTRSGKTLNADINGALNILKKSSVVDLSVLYSRGDVDTPVRVRLS